MRAAARRLRLLPAVPARLQGWPLPWGGQRPAVFPRVRSSCDRAVDRKPRAVRVLSRSHVRPYGPGSTIQRGRGTDFVDREVVLKENLLVFFAPRTRIGFANLNI